MAHSRFDIDYIARVYTVGWDACKGSDVEKHKAGLRHVVKCTQPGFLPPSDTEYEPAEEPETL